MFEYLHNGTAHTDTAPAYMRELGLDDDAIESIQNQKKYEESQEPPARKLFKQQRAKAVECMQVDVNGMTFDADEISQGRMARAAISMNDTETVTWILADNTVVQVDKSTMKAALKKAGLAQAAIWAP